MAMIEKDIKNKSKTDLKRLRELKDEDIDTCDIPEIDESFWKTAELGSPLRKKLISLRLDSDLIEWFQGQGKGYQTQINQVLKTFMEYEKLRKQSGK